MSTSQEHFIPPKGKRNSTNHLPISKYSESSEHAGLEVFHVLEDTREAEQLLRVTTTEKEEIRAQDTPLIARTETYSNKFKKEGDGYMISWTRRKS